MCLTCLEKPACAHDQHICKFPDADTYAVPNTWYTIPAEHALLVASGPGITGTLSGRPQYDCSSYQEISSQRAQLDYLSGGETPTEVQEQAHTRRPPITRDPVPQEPYESARRQEQPTGSKVIEFVVNGEEGVRLSDALEGSWTGFEGRHDTFSFGDGGRLQILLRLHFVGCSPWKSKARVTKLGLLSSISHASQVHTVTSAANRQPVTRAKLASEVAKSIRKFIAREKANGHDAVHPSCGWGDVSLEDVFLTRMVRASQASWQPEFSIERISVAEGSLERSGRRV
ncbi:hypothetical protein BJ322DRAFT_1208299 [Thelephora terrestris]|uniref:Uncharacterized protein n=1 Tax=Thelephora terrestris TaxID=56493 RepID=A0A9P6LBD0_9AGAM|nr:hypothetical protein BJ322DRAFT_1208299 [Thelephora terrestris]